VALYIALLRGINVGGTGILPMKELVGLCSDLGFQSIRTHIQSGNVVFESRLKENAIRSSMEKALAAKMGKPIDVMVRTPEEMRAVLSSNPFPGREPAKVAVAFLQEVPAHDLNRNVVAPGGEQLQPGRREIYIYYPDGMGRSKLKLPLNGAKATVRNMNTVAKLVAMTEL
jgi:uncharacterized protein (DUF1697 family)